MKGAETENVRERWRVKWRIVSLQMSSMRTDSTSSLLSTSNSTGICVRCVPVVFVPLTTLTIKTTNTSKAQARLPLKVFKLC
jgi:hypothetical protein